MAESQLAQTHAFRLSGMDGAGLKDMSKQGESPGEKVLLGGVAKNPDRGRNPEAGARSASQEPGSVQQLDQPSLGAAHLMPIGEGNFGNQERTRHKPGAGTGSASMPGSMPGTLPG